MALYRGYHYGFAGFDADPDYLARTFNAVLTYSHDSNLLMLLARRVDIAVVTRSYLEIFLDRPPELVTELLVSERLLLWVLIAWDFVCSRRNTPQGGGVGHA
jgi:hypothetical protein